jgi:hypothetical protein
MANRKRKYVQPSNLHIANLSLDLFLGAVRTEPEGQRDFVPIPLDVIDTTGTISVKAKCRQSQNHWYDDYGYEIAATHVHSGSF